MQKITMVGILLGICFAGIALAQPIDYRQFPHWAGQYDASRETRGVSMYGNSLISADGSAGIRVLDVSDPPDCRLLGFADTPGAARFVRTVGHMAYVADGMAGFEVMDLTDLSAIRVVAAAATSGECWDVLPLGDFAIAAVGDAGLEVFYVGTLSAPIRVGLISTAGSTRKLASDGQYLYVANYCGGLQIYDVAIVPLPTLLGSVVLSGCATDVVVSKGVAYVAAEGFCTVDVSDPSSPHEIGRVPFYARTVAVTGHVACAASPEEESLGLIDVADPTSLELFTRVEFIGRPQGVCAISENTVAVAGTGLQFLDVPNLQTAIERGRISVQGNAIRTHGDYVYLVQNGGVQSVLKANPTMMSSAGYLSLPNLAEFQTIGDFGCAIADGDLVTVSLSDPAHMTIQDRFSASLSGRMATTSRYVYAMQVWNLHVYDVTNPGDIQFVRTVAAGELVNGVVLSGNLLCLTTSDGRYLVFDIAEPSSPQLVSSLTTWRSPQDMVIVGTHGFAALSYRGMDVIDFTNLAAPSLECSLVTPYNGSAIAASGNYAYMSGWIGGNYSGLQVVDIAAPAAPKVIGFIDQPAGAVAIDEDILFFGGTGQMSAYPVQWEYHSDLDCNGNGISDLVELARHPGADRNADGILDNCQQGEGLSGVGGDDSASVSTLVCQPNPFNPRTTIKYDLPEAGPVRLSVFDLAGRLVSTLVDESMPQGSHEAVWDGRDTTGREVGSGSYLARLSFGGLVETVRMGLVR